MIRFAFVCLILLSLAAYSGWVCVHIVYETQRDIEAVQTKYVQSSVQPFTQRTDYQRCVRVVPPPMRKQRIILYPRNSPLS